MSLTAREPAPDETPAVTAPPAADPAKPRPSEILFGHNRFFRPVHLPSDAYGARALNAAPETKPARRKLELAADRADRISLLVALGTTVALLAAIITGVLP